MPKSCASNRFMGTKRFKSTKVVTFDTPGQSKKPSYKTRLGSVGQPSESLTLGLPWAGSLKIPCFFLNKVVLKRKKTSFKPLCLACKNTKSTPWSLTKMMIQLELRMVPITGGVHSRFLLLHDSGNLWSCKKILVKYSN